ncbi:MAG: hypothetical protein IEMM0008_0501 [bacterium]|nr:MAG: hypothetical protein IEMM0008_0501 [bacterium]
MDYYNKSLDIEKEYGNQPNFAVVTNNIGTVYFRKGNLNKALELFQAALKIDEKLNIEQGIAIDKNNIGMVYREKKKYDEAITQFQESIRLHEKFNQSFYAAGGHNNLGLTYKLKGKLDMALTHYNKSIKFYESLRDKKREAAVYTNIGELYFNDKKDLSGAFRAYEKANQRYIQINDNVGIAYSSWWMGYIQELSGQYYPARDYYEKAHAAYRLANRKEVNVIKQFIQRINRKILIAKRGGKTDKDMGLGNNGMPSTNGDLSMGLDGLQDSDIYYLPPPVVESVSDRSGIRGTKTKKRRGEDDGIRVEEELILDLDREKTRP